MSDLRKLSADDLLDYPSTGCSHAEWHAELRRRLGERDRLLAAAEEIDLHALIVDTLEGAWWRDEWTVPGDTTALQEAIAVANVLTPVLETVLSELKEGR